MGTILEGLKAKHELIKAVGGFRIFARLDSVTAIRLQQILGEDRESEIIHLGSILTTPLPWRRQIIRNDMRLYSLKNEAIHAIARGATSCDQKERRAGNAFRWLRHNFEEVDFEVHLKILDVASRWNNPSAYMSLTFTELRTVGVSDVLGSIPESTERVIEVINQSSRGWRTPGDINLPHGLLAAVACIPDHLQQDEYSY
jgi:hypothetical protein